MTNKKPAWAICGENLQPIIFGGEYLIFSSKKMAMTYRDNLAKEIGIAKIGSCRILINMDILFKN